MIWASGHAAVLSCAGILFTAGCTHSPFEKTPAVPLGTTSSAAIRQRAQASTPKKFSVLNSIVFEKFGRSIMALGYTDVDKRADTLAVVALSPAGVKLFEFKEKGGVIQHQYVIKHLAELGDVVTAVATDIRRIYFGCVPPPDAQVTKKTYTCEFRTPVKTGVMRYVFGGRDQALLRKIVRQKGKTCWTVNYFEPRWHGKHLFHGGIVLKNHPNSYRLTVRLKDIFNADECVSTSDK